MKKLMQGLLGKAMSTVSPHVREIGLEFLEIADGQSLARVPYQPQLVGDPRRGVLHGGVVTSLLDSVGGAAVLSRRMVPSPLATLDLRIDYLRGSTPGHALYARVHCYKLTQHVAFTRGIAFNDDESDPVASMAATYMLNTQAVRRK